MNDAALREAVARLARDADAPGSTGWAHHDPDVLQAAGEVSAAFPRRLEQVISGLTGLDDRLRSPSARFLDVGVGVARLSIEMIRVWPELHVLGIDPWAPALALARENVRLAGLSERITLREQGGESLEDEAAFDLAWIPGLFIPDRLWPAVVTRAHVALRPGGFLLVAGVSERTHDRVEPFLRDLGLTEIQTLPSPPASSFAVVAARRSPG